MGAQDVQTRNAATLKSLSIRMRSIKNMQKITKAMKMVAAAKMKKDQKLMDNGLPFSAPIQDLFARLPREEKPGTLTYFAVTSDKGLCGGVNSAVNKRVRLVATTRRRKATPVRFLLWDRKVSQG